jgi:DEAD/DEAH box helicase domain-containing protein
MATVVRPADEICPVCRNSIAAFSLFQPRGFRTSYQPRDYDDEADSFSHPGYPALAAVDPASTTEDVGALTLETYEQAQVVQANDNRGDLFPLRRLSDASVVAADDSLFPPRTWKTPPGIDLGDAAIGELRTTDALVVGLDRPDVPGGIVATARSLMPAGPAAFWSFAEVLRRACQVALDIDPQELVMGLQAIYVDGTLSSQVFLADALDNGAGYASELGRREAFKKILDEAREELARAWEGPSHADCTVSCPDCLRSYDNRRLHGALDWRLALDMLDLAAGEPLRESRWLARAPLAAEAFVRSMGGSLSYDVIEELPVLLNPSKSKATVLGHPLWRRDIEHLTERQSLVLDILERDRGISCVAFSDLYEVDRLPLAVLRKLV